MNQRAKITLLSDSFAVRSLFYESFFFQISSVDIKKYQPKYFVNADCVIIPCDNAYGFATNQSGTLLLMSVPGKNLEEVVRTKIYTNYLGEQPKGTAMMIPTVDNKKTGVRFICWVCIGRAPGDIAPDFAYSTLWSALSTVTNFNKEIKSKGEPPITKIIIPDLNDWVTSPAANVLQDVTRQMSLALKTWISGEYLSIDEISQAVKRHKEILTPHKGTKEELILELEGLLLSRSLDNRGVCSLDELEILIGWVNEVTGPHSLDAAATLCRLLTQTQTAEYALSQSVISSKVTSSTDGCMDKLVLLGLEGKVQVHEEIKKDNLEIGSKIGEGNAGSVFQATWNSLPVAVKLFRSDVLGEASKELIILSLLKHPNIINCYGGYIPSSGEGLLVEELMEGSLYDVLHEPSIDLSEEILISFALNCAAGMTFFHQCGLIHRDLKSLNLLISKDLTLKICDLGLTRVVDKKAQMTSNIGTVAWIAPEVFHSKTYTEKADVYSFGIILWELRARKIPFDDMATFQIPLLITKGARPPIPKHTPKSWAILMEKCWHKKGQNRPSFSQIYQTLRSIEADILSIKGRVRGDSDSNMQLLRSHKGLYIANKDLLQLKSSTGIFSSESTSKGSSDGSHEKSSQSVRSSPDSSGSEVTTSSSDNKTRSKTSSTKPRGKRKRKSSVSISIPVNTKSGNTLSLIPGVGIPKGSIFEETWTKVSQLLCNQFKNELSTSCLHSGKSPYLLMPGSAFSTNFYLMFNSIFGSSVSDLVEFSSAFLFNLARNMANYDFANFVTESQDCLESLAYLPVLLTFYGWGATRMLKQSYIAEDDFFLTFTVLNSLENAASHTKQKSKGRSSRSISLEHNDQKDFKKKLKIRASGDSDQEKSKSHDSNLTLMNCPMLCGFYSEWCSLVLDSKITVVECLCKSLGDAECLFIAAEESVIEAKLVEFCEKHSNDYPKLFQESYRRQILERSKALLRPMLFPTLQPTVSPIISKRDNKQVSKSTSLELEKELVLYEQFKPIFSEVQFSMTGTIELEGAYYFAVSPSSLIPSLIKTAATFVNSNDKYTSEEYLNYFLYCISKQFGASYFNQNKSLWDRMYTDSIPNILPFSPFVNLTLSGWGKFKVDQIQYCDSRHPYVTEVTFTIEDLSYNSKNQILDYLIPVSIFVGWYETCYSTQYYFEELNSSDTGVRQFKITTNKTTSNQDNAFLKFQNPEIFG